MKEHSSLKQLKSFKMIFAGFLIILTIIPIFLWGTEFFSFYMSILTPIISLLASIIIIHTAWWAYKTQSDTFRPWVVLAMAMSFYSLASFFYFLLPDIHVISDISLADIFYIPAYPLLVAGIMLFMKKPYYIKYKDLLDAMIIMVSAFFIVWFLLVWPAVEPSQSDTVSMIISISYLFLDLIVLFVILALLFNENRKIAEFPIFLFAIGMFIQVLGDMVYAYNVVNPFLAYQWIFTILYASNSIMIILAVLAFRNNIEIDSRYTISHYRKIHAQNDFFSYLPLVLVIFTYALLIITTPDEALIWGVGVVVVLVIVRQIVSLNEIKRNKEEISQKKEQLSFITSNMMDLITESDENGILRYVSPSSLQMSGFPPEYLVGKSVQEFIHPDDLEELNQSMEKSKASRSSVRIRYRTRNAEGKYMWVESVGRPVFDNGNIRGFIYSTRDITEQKKSDEMVKNSLAEKETLLKEIHHRVNNNLQIIISLLNLQSHSVENEKEHDLFVNTQNRVRSMAMIHEKLYQSHNLSSINFSDYLKTLLSSLIYSYSQNMSRVDLDLDVGEVELNIETSVPCGLIINELVSNSLQHAFPEGGEGTITVKMRQDGDRYVLIVGDNGQGYRGDSQHKNNSLGLQLVHSLVNQLDGTMEMLEGKGTVYKIIFHELKYNERM